VPNIAGVELLVNGSVVSSGGVTWTSGGLRQAFLSGLPTALGSYELTVRNSGSGATLLTGTLTVSEVKN